MHARVDRTLPFPENGVARRRVPRQQHIRPVIVEEGRDGDHDVVETVGVEPPLFGRLHNDIVGETVVVPRDSLLKRTDEEIGRENEDADRNEGMIGVVAARTHDVGDPSLRVGLQRRLRIARDVADLALHGDEGRLGVVRLMEGDHVGEIDIAEMVAVGQNDGIARQFVDAVADAAKRLEPIGVDHRVGLPRFLPGRQDLDPTRTARQIPVLTRTDVVHERTEVVVGDDVDVGDVRVHHIREGEIDEPIAASERNGGDRAVARQKRERIAVQV